LLSRLMRPETIYRGDPDDLRRLCAPNVGADARSCQSAVRSNVHVGGVEDDHELTSYDTVYAPGM